MKSRHQQQFVVFLERHGVVRQTVGALPEVVGLPGITSIQIRDNLVSVSPGDRPNALVFEPLQFGNMPRLALAVNDRQAVVRVNGAVIGPTRVLSVRDVVECDGDPLALHVSIHQTPYFGAPQADHVGRECGVCLTPIVAQPERAIVTDDADSIPCLITECIVCGLVFHERMQLGAGGDILECARSITACPSCSQPIIRKEGYVHVPEF